MPRMIHGTVDEKLERTISPFWLPNAVYSGNGKVTPVLLFYSGGFWSLFALPALAAEYRWFLRSIQRLISAFYRNGCATARIRYWISICKGAFVGIAGINTMRGSDRNRISLCRWLHTIRTAGMVTRLFWNGILSVLLQQYHQPRCVQNLHVSPAIPGLLRFNWNEHAERTVKKGNWKRCDTLPNSCCEAHQTLFIYYIRQILHLWCTIILYCTRSSEIIHVLP